MHGVVECVLEVSQDDCVVVGVSCCVFLYGLVYGFFECFGGVIVFLVVFVAVVCFVFCVASLVCVYCNDQCWCACWVCDQLCLHSTCGVLYGCRVCRRCDCVIICDGE